MEHLVLPNHCGICGTNLTSESSATSFFLEAPLADQIKKLFRGKCTLFVREWMALNMIPGPCGIAAPRNSFHYLFDRSGLRQWPTTPL